MTLQKITLLTKEEYEKYKVIIPIINNSWWLRSPGCTRLRVAIIDNSGKIDERGYYVDYVYAAVRPALKFDLEPSDNPFWYKPEKLIGTKIKYGNYLWTVLNLEPGSIYALCDAVVSTGRFDIRTNDWDKSELKRWLETEMLNSITT